MQISIGPPCYEYQIVTKRFLLMFFIFYCLELTFYLEGSSAKGA